MTLLLTIHCQADIIGEGREQDIMAAAGCEIPALTLIIIYDVCISINVLVTITLIPLNQAIKELTFDPTSRLLARSLLT